MEGFVMAITADLLQSLVPISQFNKGQAAKIFDRLHSERELIVLKNNQPSAVILSPEEYIRLMEIEEDYFLLLEANKRMGDNGNNKTISFDSVMSDLGISEDELLDMEDVDIE
jgi:PHD/YefM family antitoxin component YafN of YafNO toxin-antitoxin module